MSYIPQKSNRHLWAVPQSCPVSVPGEARVGCPVSSQKEVWHEDYWQWVARGRWEGSAPLADRLTLVPTQIQSYNPTLDSESLLLLGGAAASVAAAAASVAAVAATTEAAAAAAALLREGTGGKRNKPQTTN